MMEEMEDDARVVKEGGDGMLNSLHGKDHLRLLPPSANWYCSKICDWGRSDMFGLLFAFGAKNSVFIYQVTSEQPGAEARVKVSFFAQLVRGKRDRRVTAVQFLTDSTGELRLLCGGEEGSVQIWDVAALTMIEQHRKHKAEVMAVTVSTTLDANFVVAGDRQGRISAWERDAGKVSVFIPISGDGIHSMAISPLDKTLVAVGYRSGVLCLVDAGQGTVRHRFAGHDQEVQCVAWKSTVGSNYVTGENDEDLMKHKLPAREIWLASSSRDKTIKVWKITPSVIEESTLEQVLRLPTGKQGMSFTQTKQLWLPVAWSLNDAQKASGKHCLWSGSFDGSLFRWEWNVTNKNTFEKSGKNRRASCKPVVIKGGHNRMLFSIVIVPPRNSVSAGEDAVSMLTVSLDRELRLWKENVSSKSAAAAVCFEKLTGLGGHVYSVSHNAATGIVAAGIGDQSIRLWNLETASVAGDYQCDLLWKGLQSKVTCVRWHPLQHSMLAYGMEDGRIGTYDIQTKNYSHFRTSHDREVQQLQWIVLRPNETNDADNDFIKSIKQLEAAQTEGQSLEDALIVQEEQTRKTRDGNDVKVLLWSCDAGGLVLESNSEAIDQKSREIMPDCAAFEWEEQCELIAVGRANGVVEVMKWGECTESNRAVQHFHEHLEMVTCLAWSKSTISRLLASGGQDGKIFVYNCGKICSNVANLPSSYEATQESLLLGAHSNKITSLRWCSDVDQNVLATTSADGSVQVWNYTSLQREAYFNHHIGRVLSLDWVSPYVLVTGGEDQTLRLWDYRRQPNMASSKLKKHGKVKQPQEIEVIASLPPADIASVELQQEVEDTLVAQHLINKGDGQTSVNTIPKKIMAVFHPEKKLTPAEVALACSRVARRKLPYSLSDNVDDKDHDSSIDSLLAHTDRISLQGFFASESKRFRGEREWESLANTLLLQGNVSEALRIVAKEGALSPTWLSYAPMAGMDVWREMTNLYAHQLDSRGDKKTAAFHFLSIGKVHSAVTCLVSGDAYKEALALIRSRLGPNDPLLHDTLWKYGEFLSKRGRHGEAALALLNIGSIKAKTRAVHMLVKTGDMICVKAALDVLQIAAEFQVEPREMTQKSDGEGLAFPASFFISIAGLAISKNHFDVAEAAGQLLQSQLVSSSLPSHRLTSCLLSILNAFDEHQLARCTLVEGDDEVESNRVNKLLLSDAPESVREFFTFLRKETGNDNANHLYNRIVNEYLPRKQMMTDRTDHFWFQALSACRRSGYWFDADGETRVQEAQDLLVGDNCFADIDEAVATSSQKVADHSTTSLQVAQRLLRFIVDVMSTSFIGALEQMRDTFLFLTQDECIEDGMTSITEQTLRRSACDLRLDVMTLLFPCGFVSLSELPQCGELAEEQLDTQVLWSSMLLSQCRIILATSISIAKSTASDCTENLESTIRLLLRFLDVWFLNDEATLHQSHGLMDTSNQLELQALMNEVLVGLHRLPHEPDTQDEKTKELCVDEKVGDASEVSSKQALINDANDMLSRLTWNDDSGINN